MDRIQPRWRGALGLAFGASLLSITQAWAAEVTNVAPIMRRCGTSDGKCKRKKWTSGKWPPA